MIPRVDVLGVGVSAIDMDAALEEIGAWVEHGERHYVCVTGVHGVMESQRDPELKRIHNDSGLTTPDGMPMVWAGKRAGATGMALAPRRFTAGTVERYSPATLRSSSRVACVYGTCTTVPYAYTGMFSSLSHFTQWRDSQGMSSADLKVFNSVPCATFFSPSR